ncbi:TetR/AcrR family transcriptional regulator [Streptomyces longispororuber]|uniref:TetR/AcrR family transcriptional regulator n=1 Tax=Streptomyces longispororuber TaxID=68230 RepID=UPI0033CF7DEA
MATTETSGSGDITRTLELLWGDGERPTRGPKPALTLERIVTAAVRLADAEGIAAVSMRRLSQELGTGTMSLYRYLPGKAELLDLMLDHVQTPADDDVTVADGWRAGVEAHARETLARYQAHPWLLHVNQSRPVLGPSTVGSLEKILARIKPTGLSDPELISVLIMVEGYVSGVARTYAHTVEAEKSGLSEEAFWEKQGPLLERVMTSGRYPFVAGLSEEAFGPDFDHFEFGLQRILDGLDVLVEQRRREAERD